MTTQRPYTLSIAGLDPTGGAGILADIKTFEQTGVQGFAVATSLTYQTEERYFGQEWVNLDTIIKQVEPLLERYPIRYIKIGLIENFKVLSQLLQYLRAKGNYYIIWDTILSTSSGTDIHQQIPHLDRIIQEVNLITPNVPEAEKLFGTSNAEKLAYDEVSILLKGGHDNFHDILVHEKDLFKFPGEPIEWKKHGTGCILSAAITGELAKGSSLEQACRTAKSYVEERMQSNPSLLAFHNFKYDK